MFHCPSTHTNNVQALSVVVFVSNQQHVAFFIQITTLDFILACVFSKYTSSGAYVYVSNATFQDLSSISWMLHMGQ